MSSHSENNNLVRLDRYRLRHLHDANFYSTVHETSGRCLVIFTSKGCASCRAWKEILLAYLQGFAGMTIFEVDAHESMALASEYEVFHLPALFLFQDGDYHCELRCEANVDVLHRAMEAAFAAPPQEEP
ncbi:MAG: thioredoxin family protein [Gammaproteobacteria bacterium]|nr:thioredoxin family protein [Gammaproteobacteria bacterium]MDH5651134.1 thioredoxin family protein [Gammaproteobacteria bacterium]